MDKRKQNFINHIALVLDRSSSMSPHAEALIKVADAQVAYLAQRSKELDQETRVTIYVFANDVECVVYDKDVLRLPSIREFYKPYGWTSLLDGTLQALDDLKMTPEKYGDHAFLLYVLTDGAENASRRSDKFSLADRINALPNHWTMAALVPDQTGKHEAKRFGFPADNIAVWDTSSVKGVAEVGETIKKATDTFMTNRAKGVRGTKNLFGGAAVVNDATIQAAALTPLPTSAYVLIPVPPQPVEKKDEPIKIKEFVEGCNHHYMIGKAYYQLNKRERIQGNKDIVIVEKSTAKVFKGDGVRAMLGLPDLETRVYPDTNPKYQIFIQSTSVNRYLEVGTKLLLLK